MFIRILLACALLGSTSLHARVHSIKTIKQYNEAFAQETPMITMYSGNHCGPCKTMKPHLERLSDENPDIFFCIINTSFKELKSLVQTNKIRSVPTLIFSWNGEKLFDEIGSMSAKDIKQSIKNFRYEMDNKMDIVKQSKDKKRKAPNTKKPGKAKKVNVSK